MKSLKSRNEIAWQFRWQRSQTLDTNTKKKITTKPKCLNYSIRYCCHGVEFSQKQQPTRTRLLVETYQSKSNYNNNNTNISQLEWNIASFIPGSNYILNILSGIQNSAENITSILSIKQSFWLSHLYTNTTQYVVQSYLKAHAL